MFLSKRDKIYYLWYFDAAGNRQKISTRSKTKSGAVAFLRRFQPDEAKPEVSAITISNFTGKFIEHANSIYRSTTTDLYRLALNSFLNIVGNIELNAIGALHVDQYKAAISKNISPVTVNMRLAKLKAAFNTAKRWNLLTRNPFEGVKQMLVLDTVPIHLTKDEFIRLYAAIQESWLRELVLFAVSTGMRRGEILNLRWNAIDLERKTILVQSDPTFRTKLGQKRIIPLNNQIHQLLLEKSNAIQEKSDFVFELNNAPVYEDWVTHKFKKYVMAVLPDNAKVHFHSLRATFATWLVENGVSLYEAQKLLGHSSITVTQIHAHLAPNEVHKTVNRISLAL